MKSVIALMLLFVFCVSAKAQTEQFCVTSPSQTPNYNQTCMEADQNGGSIGVINHGTATGGLNILPFTNGTFIATVANPSVLASAAGAASFSQIKVTAMATTGTSTCSLTFSKGSTMPTGIFGEILNTPSGIYFEPNYSTSPVKGCEFGMVADGNFSNITGAICTIPCTDNTPMVQAAINFALQNQYEAVCFNNGNYELTDTIQVGWGDGFYSTFLSQCNNSRNGVQASSAGTLFIPTKIDRCVFNFQGQRFTGMRGITLAGQNIPYFFFGGFPNPWPSTATGWLAPALRVSGTNPGGLQQYAPYSGVCIDAYTGDPPTTISQAAYPIVTGQPAFTNLSSAAVSIASGSPAVMTFPGSAFTAGQAIACTSGTLPSGFSLNTYYYVKSPSGSTFNLSATKGGSNINTVGSASALTCSRQYGLKATSDTLIEDADIEGFAVGINSKPTTGTDANGDFLKIHRVQVANNVYGISIGNAQARATEMVNINYAFNYAVLTNNQFGAQAGQLGGPISNISGGQSYQIFQIGNLSDGAPFEAALIYAEALVRIGTFGGGSTGNSVTFQGCNIIFAPQGFSNLVPVAYFEAPGGKVTLTLNDCFFAEGNRIDSIVHGSASLIMSGGAIVNGNVGIPFLNLPGLPVAFNYTGGALASGSAVNFPATNGQSLQWIGPTSAQRMTSQTAFSNQVLQRQADFTSYGVRAAFTQATTGFVDSLNQRKYEFAWGPFPGTVNLSSGAVTGTPAAISSCDILTFTYLAAQQAAASQTVNINTGDILYWIGDGTFFVVTQVGALSGGAYPITARQMNNMTINASDSSCATNNINDPTLTGNTTIIHTAGTNYADVSPIGAGTPGNIMIPQRVYFGNFVKGTTNVASVSLNGPGGNGTGFDTYMNANDLIWNYSFNDPNLRWPYASGNKLSTVTAGSPGSATLSAAALRTGSFPILPLPVVGMGVSALDAGFRYSAAGTALPTCNAATNGEQLYVSDATTPSYHGAYASGGAIIAGVICLNGTGWVTN